MYVYVFVLVYSTECVRACVCVCMCAFVYGLRVHMYMYVLSKGVTCERSCHARLVADGLAFTVLSEAWLRDESGRSGAFTVNASQ